MRDARAVMHVGIANPRWGKRSRYFRCMRNPQFYISGKGLNGQIFTDPVYVIKALSRKQKTFVKIFSNIDTADYLAFGSYTSDGNNDLQVILKHCSLHIINH